MLHIEPSEILLGVRNCDTILNLIIMVTKWALYKKKNEGKRTNINQIKNKLKMMQTEKCIANMKQKRIYSMVNGHQYIINFISVNHFVTNIMKR